LNDFKEIGDAVHVADRIQTHLTSSSLLEGLNRVTTASIGIVVYNSGYLLPQDLLRDADSAMYRAKSMGGGGYQIYDDSVHAGALALLQLETDLKQAVERQEWQVFYQPILSLPDRAILGVEAMVRWNHPLRGVLGPTEFIQVAEETGQILPLGEFVLSESCRQVKAWREKQHPGLLLSVNLSARQFQDPHLLESIQKALAEAGLPGDSLQLEITESLAMQDYAYSVRIMTGLSEMGIRIALDDFGNGYSSLSYLNRFPIRILKIDRSFIGDLAVNRSSEAIVSAIVSMGHALHLEVTAEGVETEEQLSFLQATGCDKIQGHLISRPLPAEQIERLL
jgi:EAL domain-containing protein (putative c-di-GMP-specific phosphodiesterase class I)